MEKYKATKNQQEGNVEADVPEKSEKQKKLESTEKAVNIAGEAALDYFTGGMGTQVKDMAGNVPVVGKKVNKTWDKAVNKVSKVVAKTPVGDVLKKADDMGITDAAGKAKNMINFGKGGGGGAPKGVSPQNAGTASTAKNANGKNNKVQKGNTNSSEGNARSSSVFSSNSSPFTKNVVSFPGMNMKKVVIVGLVILLFLNALVVIVAGKDMANLGLTNETTVTSTSESVNVSSDTLNGSDGNLMADGQSLLSVLGQEKIDSWNTKIQNSVNDAGIGTGSAPATAAYTLVKGALDEGIVLPYFWGGGHGAISTGVNSNWGSKVKVTASGSSKQPAGSYFPSGLDCSGFVSWALKNGGCTDFTARVSGNFTSLGPKINPSSAKAGDIPANSTHVMIILENTGSSLLVAEAKAPGVGIVFSEYDYSYFNNYTVVDMSNYYSTNCKG